MDYINAYNHHTQCIRVMQEHFGDKPFTAIEIGTAEGLLTKGLLMYMPNLTMIYAVDPCLFIPGTGFEAGMYDQAWHDDRYAQAEKALAEYPGRYTHVRMKSDDAVPYTPEQVDLVWIDGDHSESAIRSDIRNYYAKIKPGGILGGHDWDKAIRVVLEECEENPTLGRDLTWWLTKKSS